MELVVCLLFVVLHSPRSARWLTPLRGAHVVLLYCPHYFMFIAALLSSSGIYILVFAALFILSTCS